MRAVSRMKNEGIKMVIGLGDVSEMCESILAFRVLIII